MARGTGRAQQFLQISRLQVLVLDQLPAVFRETRRGIIAGPGEVRVGFGRSIRRHFERGQIELAPVVHRSRQLAIPERVIECRPGEKKNDCDNDKHHRDFRDGESTRENEPFVPTSSADGHGLQTKSNLFYGNFKTPVGSPTVGFASLSPGFLPTTLWKVEPCPELAVALFVFNKEASPPFRWTTNPLSP